MSGARLYYNRIAFFVKGDRGRRGAVMGHGTSGGVGFPPRSYRLRHFHRHRHFLLFIEGDGDGKVDEDNLLLS
jgi:hypothetical protein